MEELQALLINYNKSHSDDFSVAPWSHQYSSLPFPKYWEVVYEIMQTIDRKERIIEIGCGLGDITSIFCHLGFEDIKSFEKNKDIFTRAHRRMKDMFNRDNIIINSEFPNGNTIQADVLVLVNCAYFDLADSKKGYLKLMKEYYLSAGQPHLFLMEVIDSSYKEDNPEFPQYIRLSHDDVVSLFPDCKIKYWETYIYPINKKSKTLYLIEQR